ncbi:hypothetical protein COV23_02480 [Candidatus Wolfebacteria bacterium CG10_big_fil_rev_8_21_14_0_10_31_9]|uniref:Type IV secretion system coupling protein TraD DNA-binding domain-containing protein n=1 Tax=Candidatus Wolfebacteria bacterium CG10_big_fil_rev_8_21_14_0_10_31_9 TaxID=1975070 RepID=A0A2H0RBV4_9BACT|nr:MAG: hypothetical protein COV23_02480 [Candidatus Wolfebacteria bacterium CG10_big_fil_rev_8_21_14_0_10_31_9]
MDDQQIIVFAKTNFRNKERAFGIKSKDRRQHMYIIGKTGVGKTTLLENLAVQDIINGKGLCIVDPHGEFVENVASKIPASRLKDVIYFNPVDVDYPIGFNVLEVPDPKYKHLVASDLMGIFTKIWANVWSSRMEYILNNCILALVDTPGTTLMGIQRILVDKEYRQQIISNIKDPVVKSFWIHEYETWRDQFRNEAIVPIQNKVGQFLSTALIRNIVSQEKSSINIKEIMDSEKILLVNVSKGKIGEDNAALLGAMIITKIQLAAMERVRIDTAKRKDFYLYVDEFQNFATESFANILSEARKYKLNLIVAHQYIGQLMDDKVTKVRDAIFGNVGTMMSFRVGATDAEFLEKEFEPEFGVQDLINLPNHEIYLKLMVDGVTSRPFSAFTLPPLELNADKSNLKDVIKITRERYGRSRIKVEEDIARWSGMSIMMPKTNDHRKGQGQASGFKNGQNSQRPSSPSFERRDSSRPQKFKYADVLGDMGIEFEPQKRAATLMETLESKSNSSKENLNTEQRHKEHKEEKFLSLKDLPKPEEKKRKETSKIPLSNIEELKEAIKKALSEKEFQKENTPPPDNV